MKSYEQMAKDVLKRRDEYLVKKQQRRTTFRYYMPMMASFCFAVLVGLSIWQDLQKLPEIPFVTVETKSDISDSEIMISEQENPVTEQTATMTEQTESEQILIDTTTEFTEYTDLTESAKPTQESVQTSVMEAEISFTSDTEKIFTSSVVVTDISSTQDSITSVSYTTVVNSGTAVSTGSSTVIPVTTSISQTDVSEPPVVITTSTSRTTEIMIHTTTTKASNTNTETQIDPTEPTGDIFEPTIDTNEPICPVTTEPIEPTDSTDPIAPSDIESNPLSPEVYYTCVLSNFEQVFEYQTSDLEVSEDKIEAYLQQVELFGYDKNGNYRSYQADAYAIISVSVQDAIAVQFPDMPEYYIYTNINLTSEQQELLLAGL